MWLVLLLGAVGLVVMGYVLHRAASWAEGRGWIYYTTKRRPGGAGLSLIGQIYQPSIEHVVEEQQSDRIRADQDDAGAPPDDEVG